MNDISFCPGTGCPLKERCRRYTFGLNRVDLGDYGYWWIVPAYSNCKCDNYLINEPLRMLKENRYE